jgi:hypothetical protein
VSVAPGIVQVPSTQLPLRHCELLVHSCPPGVPQLPSAAQTPLAHWFAAVQALEASAAHVFVAALQSVLAHVAFAFASVHVPSWRPSFGIALPTRSFAVHVVVSRLQYWSAAQSPSTQHLPAGMQTPDEEHAPDWHAVAALSEHGPWPSARPHLPFDPHTFATHSFARAQVPPFTMAHVFVTALQRPLAQTAFAVTSLQTPTWSVSLGSASPAALSATQVKLSRLQCSAAAQSPSTQHEPAPAGMHTPSALQAPDWHVAVLPGVQPDWPSARPHFAFPPHTFATHWFALVHAVPFAAAQVFATALQEPVAQTAAAAAASQVPLRMPSVGIGALRSRSGAQRPAVRLQCSFASQSESTQQPPFGVQSALCGEHSPDWQRLVALAAEQVPSPSARPHLPFEPQAFATHSFAEAHGAPFAPAQVPVVALQRPLAQAALNPPLTQLSWSASVGRAAPARSIGVQVKLARWQKLPPAQSASVQQLEVPCGMQALTAPSAFALHRPDWQSSAPVATVQGPLPFGVPHTFATHTFATHSAAKTQAALFDDAHVFVTALHRPLTHTFSARACVQTPSWRPSLGSATPATLSAAHLRVLRSQ